MSLVCFSAKVVISDENARALSSSGACLQLIRGLWINMAGGVCRFPNRKAMNVSTPRGSNYNKGIAPVTGGKLQDHLCNLWSN